MKWDRLHTVSEHAKLAQRITNMLVRAVSCKQLLKPLSQESNVSESGLSSGRVGQQVSPSGFGAC